MKQIGFKTNCALAFVIAGILAAGQAVAAKPPWAGSGKGEKGEWEKSERKQGRQHFGDRHRTIVYEYYGEQFRSGRCPPGLAKKNNGCMPPGLAKKWMIGRPLPPDVIYYAVPPALVVQLGQPPGGYRYVRVASDILLIALGTGMVIDAIQDLGRI